MTQIICVVGPIASGKGEVVKILRDEYGFFSTSLSDRIREERERRGLPDTRETLQKLGNKLRKLYGNDILCEMTIQLMEDQQRIVVESIRHPDEIKFFQNLSNVDLRVLSVYSLPQTRFGRLKKRNREGDPKTLEEFRILNDRENKPTKKHQINLPGCIELSDHNILNEGTLHELKVNVSNYLKSIGIEGASSHIERK